MKYNTNTLNNQAVTLSISTTKPNNKEVAGFITEFKSTQIDLTDENQLRTVFSEYNYSFNYWEENNTCSKDAYCGMFGIILDIDEGITIDEAKNTFSGYKYIIHTSTSHQVQKDEKPACDRFRVILPFDPEAGLQFCDKAQADVIYSTVQAKYPFADPATSTRAAKFFPFMGASDHFQLYTNNEGVWFDIEPERKQEENKPTPAARWTAETYINHNQEIIMKDGKTRHTLVSLRRVLPSTSENKLSCYCPFCDDIESRNASATIQITTDGFIRLYCSHCKSENQQHIYWEETIEPGMFMIEDKLMRIHKNVNNAHVVRVSWEYIRKDKRDEARSFLSRTRNVPSAELKIERHASADYETVDFQLDTDAGLITIQIPSALNTGLEDNAYIDNWLKGLFGVYADFIKDWLALYCYSNYHKLPVIVLTGPRGSGKTTFAEIVARIFPDLSSDWIGDVSNFTPFFTKKFLMIEENNINKKGQYVQLKMITGSEFLTVNEKFLPQYKVRNNINIVMTTNEPRPLFLVAGETPTDANTNNFFIHKVPAVTTVNPWIKDEITKRMGHYIRTVLKEKYEAWGIALPTNAARYSIPCPITPLAEDLYASAQTGLEADAELVAEAVVCGILDNESCTTLGGKEYIMKSECNRICKCVGVRSAKSTNDYFKKLQDTGVLAYREKRSSREKSGYKVLRSKDYYNLSPENTLK